MSAGSLNIVTDGLVFEVDAANKLGGNITSTNNIVTPTQSGAFVNGLTVIDNAFDFDGIDDYINLGSVPAINTITSEITVSGWINANSAVGSKYPLAKRFNLHLQINNSTIGLNIGGVGFFSGVSFTLNEWINVSFTYNGSNVIAYIDGLQAQSFIATGAINMGTDPVSLAAFSDPFGFYNGKISTMLVYNKALTQAEITQNYEATKHKFE